jgi:hypothetical protein
MRLLVLSVICHCFSSGSHQGGGPSYLQTRIQPHTTATHASLYYVCPHTTAYVSSYYHTCVLILLHVSSHCYICVLIILQVSSCYYICVQIRRASPVASAMPCFTSNREGGQTRERRDRTPHRSIEKSIDAHRQGSTQRGSERERRRWCVWGGLAGWWSQHACSIWVKLRCLLKADLEVQLGMPAKRSSGDRLRWSKACITL